MYCKNVSDGLSGLWKPTTFTGKIIAIVNKE